MKSWLTGSRLVSLPFSDHCQPLEDESGDWIELLNHLCNWQRTSGWKYLEIRPSLELDPKVFHTTGLQECASFCFHTLDLRPDLVDLFNNFHKNAIRQPLKRAEREGITTQAGSSESLLRSFYRLLILTRRRHRLPPQPVSWFRNLAKGFEENLTIRVAFKGAQPIAGILTLAHGRSVIYKYGCSDAAFHNLGGMPLLFWEAIQAAKKNDAVLFDLGRSDLDNAGLITFKDRWGSTRTELTYYRQARSSESVLSRDWKMAVVRKACSCLPDSCLTTAGRVLYRHIG